MEGQILAPVQYDDPSDERMATTYAPALALLATGLSVKKAAEEAGINRFAFHDALKRHPKVFQAVQQERAVLRELTQLRALAKTYDRLDNDEISTRDLTDIVRATRPTDEGKGATINVLIDI